MAVIAGERRGRPRHQPAGAARGAGAAAGRAQRRRGRHARAHRRRRHGRRRRERPAADGGLRVEPGRRPGRRARADVRPGRHLSRPGFVVGTSSAPRRARTTARSRSGRPSTSRTSRSCSWCWPSRDDASLLTSGRDVPAAPRPPGPQGAAVKIAWVLVTVVVAVVLQVTLARYTVGGRWVFDLVLVGVVYAALPVGPGGRHAGRHDRRPAPGHAARDDVVGSADWPRRSSGLPPASSARSSCWSGRTRAR